MRAPGIRRHLTYANVTSSLALFAALGGSAYALTLPADSIGARQLRHGSVGRSELRNGAVHSADIHDGAVAARDLSARAQRRLRGPRGPAGPAGVSYFAVIDATGGRHAGNGAVTGCTSTIMCQYCDDPRS